MVQLPDGKIADVHEDVSLPSKPISMGMHDTLSRRKIAHKDVDNRPIKGRDDTEPFAPAPLNGGGGDDDFPSAAGAAETLVSIRKRKQEGISFS
jgi:hypothetical protein